MMKKYLLGTILFALLGTSLGAQGFAFGVKGGLSVGFQKWGGVNGNGNQRDPLMAYHGIAFIESAPEDDRFAVFAQGGYHVRGGAVRTFTRTIRDNAGNLRDLPGRTDRYEFRNISIAVGGKQKRALGDSYNSVYYFMGLRGDYTLNTNLRRYEIFNSNFAPYYPVDAFVQKFNYGVIVGGGFEFSVSDLIGIILEVTVNPDFSDQYRQPPIQNVTNPYNSMLIDLPSRELNNTTLEVTLGFRFLNRYEYIE